MGAGAAARGAQASVDDEEDTEKLAMDWRGGGKSAVLAELGKVLRASEMRKEAWEAAARRQADFEDGYAKARREFEAKMAAKREAFNKKQAQAAMELEGNIKREMDQMEAASKQPGAKRAKR